MKTVRGRLKELLGSGCETALISTFLGDELTMIPSLVWLN